MATYRVRSFYKRDSRFASTIKDRLGGLKSTSVTSISTAKQDMTDFVTKDWARLQRYGFYIQPDFAKTSRLRDAASIGFDVKYFNLLRFIPPVNSLTFVSTNVDEPLDKIEFSQDATPSLVATVDGNATQMLHLAWGNAFPAAPVVSPVTGDLQVSVLKSKVLTRCADTDYAFGEDLAEIRQTLLYIRSPLHAMRRLLTGLEKTLTRKSGLNLGQHGKNFLSAYSEQRFAMSPLLRSMDDALAASADYFHKKATERYVRIVESSDSYVANVALGTTTKNFPYAGMSHLSWGVRSEYLRTKKIEATVGIKVFHADQSSVQTLVGLRGRDIPLVFWQTLPLSFVFDRYYDVSGWLKAASNFASSNVKFAGGWVSTRTTDRHVRRYTHLNAALPFGKTLVKPAGTKPWIQEIFSLNREAWIPQLAEAKPPAKAGRLVSSLTATADLVAVSTGRLSRLSRSSSPTFSYKGETFRLK